MTSAAAVQPGLLALFQARCVHRRRTRSLSRSLRAVLNLEFDRHPNQADFHAFLDRHRIPHKSAHRLLAQAPSTRSADFDAVFRDQTLTVRLNPNHRAILELCADALQSQPAPINFGAIAVSWLRANTDGLARHEMDAFLKSYSSANLPSWCLNLPPVLVPSSASSAPRKPPRPVDFPPSSQLPTLWPDLRASRRDQRLSSRQLKPQLPNLALLLAQKHAELALAGRSGAFHAWLRAHGIPRQSAYRLLGRSSNSRLAKDLSCTNRDYAHADLVLAPQNARFRLSPLDSALAHRILLDALKRPQPRDFSALIVSAFMNRLPPGPTLSAAIDWFNGPGPALGSARAHQGAAFPLPRLFSPYPRYFSRPAAP